MNKEDRTILIEQYLDGELQGENLKSFEARLQTDKELAQDYCLQKEIRNALTNKDIFDLREKLKGISKNFEKEKHISTFRKRILLYTSAVLLVIAVISSVFICNRIYSDNELFDMYYEHYDAGTRTRGREKTATEIYKQALITYDNYQYSEAIRLFGQITDTSLFYIPKEFFTGLSYMELHKYKEAIKHFDAVTNSKQGIYYADAIWYKGLCYLKIEKTRQAMQQFRKLQNSSTCYQEQASGILEKMK